MANRPKRRPLWSTAGHGRGQQGAGQEKRGISVTSAPLSGLSGEPVISLEADLGLNALPVNGANQSEGRLRGLPSPREGTFFHPCSPLTTTEPAHLQAFGIACFKRISRGRGG